MWIDLNNQVPSSATNEGLCSLLSVVFTRTMSSTDARLLESASETRSPLGGKSHRSHYCTRLTCFHPRSIISVYTYPAFALACFFSSRHSCFNDHRPRVASQEIDNPTAWSREERSNSDCSGLDLPVKSQVGFLEDKNI